MNELALLGGTAVRTEPFLSSVCVGEEERARIDEVFACREFSRFMGSPTEDIGRLLVMDSATAVDYDSQYFTFLGGRMVRRFEADFAARFSAKYAITVSSATAGLSIALGAANVGPGDEVITTCLSFNATAMSILMFNAVPVFVDVIPGNYCLDPNKVRAAISRKTKAILPVHLLGFPANMDEILQIAADHNLMVIEDCAQAIGTVYQGKPVGTIGHMGVFSFQETKNIMTGEGGMIVTDDAPLARKARLIRNHGESVPDMTWPETDLENIVGMNCRMTELTAALGTAQLGKLDALNGVRTENAAFITEHLRSIPGITVPDFPKGAVPHLLPLIYDEGITGVPRQVILQALRAEGIPVGSGYQRLMHHNPIFQKKTAYGTGHCPWSCHMYGSEINYDRMRFPVAEELVQNKSIWFYHIFPPNTCDDMKDVVEGFKKVFSQLESLKCYDLAKASLSYKW